MKDEKLISPHPTDLAEQADRLFEQYNTAKGKLRREIKQQYNQVAELLNNRLARKAVIILH